MLIILNRLVLGGQASDIMPLVDRLCGTYDITMIYGEKEADEVEIPDAADRYPQVTFEKLPLLKRNVHPLNDIAAVNRLYRAIKKIQPQVVHTHGAKPGTVGRIAARLARVPVIIHTYHGHLFHSYYGKVQSSFIIRLERFLARFTTRLITLSDSQKTEICEKYRIATSKKVAVIRLGIDENAYTPNGGRLRTEFREKYRIDADTVATGIIGRIVPVKYHRFLVDVIEAVLQTEYKDKVKFFVVGDGYLKPQLQAWLTSKRIRWSEDSSSTATIYFTSWVSPVTDALHGLDVVVLTSLNEGTPYSLIEGQLCGKPVVATDVGGVRDTFLPGISGFLIDDHDKADFVDKLLRLINDLGLRTEMGDRGAEFARQQFPKQAEVDAIKKLYADCMDAASK